MARSTPFKRGVERAPGFHEEVDTLNAALRNGDRPVGRVVADRGRVEEPERPLGADGNLCSDMEFSGEGPIHVRARALKKYAKLMCGRRYRHRGAGAPHQALSTGPVCRQSQVRGTSYCDLVTLTSDAADATYGEVFTRRWIVELLLDLTGYTTAQDLTKLHLLEPSCGTGAFLGPAVERLIGAAKRTDKPFTELTDCIRAYDLLGENVAASRSLCRDLLIRAGATEEVAGELAKSWVVREDFLLVGIDLMTAGGDGDPPHADIVVGNPPYIRYDDLPDGLAVQYRRNWPTMRGRGDIYIGFIERALQTLKPGGRVGFICADRWMRNQYGAELRRLIAERYAMEHIWTMHDVDAFESRVAAYPAITVIANTKQRGVTIVDTTAEFGASSVPTVIRATAAANFKQVDGIHFLAHRLAHWFSGDGMWPSGSPARLALIEYLNDNFPPLNDPATATKVSIGVATGADKVYITKDKSVAEADRMLPLAMSKDLATGTFQWQGNYLVNPWGEDGKLVPLECYPKLAEYLSKQPVLLDRFVAKKDPRSWYRTIDKVASELTPKPKLLLQDMKAFINPVLEEGGHYPHHNLYYIVSDTWDVEVLGGLLLSRVAQAFVEAYCVRMRGGTLRFQAQYLRQIRVPIEASIPTAVKSQLRAAFRQRDIERATIAAAAAYGIDLEEYELLGKQN